MSHDFPNIPSTPELSKNPRSIEEARLPATYLPTEMKPDQNRQHLRFALSFLHIGDSAWLFSSSAFLFDFSSGPCEAKFPGEVPGRVDWVRLGGWGSGRGRGRGRGARNVDVDVDVDGCVSE